jgi:uncharacterized protein (UPF0333 family)
MKRSQVAMQFLVVIGIVFVMFIIFVIGFAERYRDIQVEKETVAMKDIALKLHDEIVIARNLQDGYSRNFTMPDTVDGFNYTISLNQNLIIVTGEHAEYSTYVAPVQGQVRKGTNVIRKIGDTVWLD